MNRITLPAELEPLKPLRQWVLWRIETPPGRTKPTKPPYSPVTGSRAKSNDPGTWGTYEQAAAMMERDTAGYFQGMGIMLVNGLFGVDIDACIDPLGRISDPTAAAIVQTADSYTEYSPSGLGVHVLMYGSKPEDVKDCKRHIADPIRGDDDIVAEIYDNGRYFTVTGNPYGSPKPVQERTAQARLICAAILQAGDALKAKRQPQQPQSAPERPQNAPQAPQGNSTPTDTEIIQRAMSSARGAEFARLWSGDTSAHGNDHSAADMALVNHLAYWTNGDPARMDQLFRQSGLMREKWDSRRGGSTYGANTIAAALKSFTPYTPPAPPSAASEFAGIAGAGQAPAAAPPSVDLPLFPGAPSEDNPQPDDVTRYLTGDIDADISRFQQFKDRKTGLFNLNEAAGALYPGLYVVGAISSLGKTTFCHQLGDHLAATGEHVLFFSLEQSRLEMVLKSIARTTATIALQGYQLPPSSTGSVLRNVDLKQRGAVPAITIRAGHSSPIVQQARQQYAATVGHRMNVIQCNFNTSIEAIRDYVTRYMERNHTRPVIILDYLQIVPASDARMDERRKTDHIIRGLKKLQADNDLLIFVVSSLNRSNYLAPIDFESFKESGGIEYTADVVWGLQLAAIHSDVFNKDNKLKEKRETIRKAKAAIPRSIELVCLKNRYGVSSYSCLFDYDPRYDLFVPSIGVQGAGGT